MEILTFSHRHCIMSVMGHLGRSFAIEVFSDKVMIYSPGLFPAGFKPEDFADNSAEPIMLNPKIVNVLFKCSVIESFGTGFERTFASCKAVGVNTNMRIQKRAFVSYFSVLTDIKMSVKCPRAKKRFTTC